MKKLRPPTLWELTLMALQHLDKSRPGLPQLEFDDLTNATNDDEKQIILLHFIDGVQVELEYKDIIIFGYGNYDWPEISPQIQPHWITPPDDPP